MLALDNTTTAQSNLVQRYMSQTPHDLREKPQTLNPKPCQHGGGVPVSMSLDLARWQVQPFG